MRVARVGQLMENGRDMHKAGSDMALFSREITISFGDCDPAGIVYYPNYYRWMDGTFHAFLYERGDGHTAMCREMGTIGFGLMDSGMAFRSPGREGDKIVFSIEDIEWAKRSFLISYRAMAGDRLLLEGHERRGIFIEKDGVLSAGEVAPLRDRIG